MNGALTPGAPPFASGSVAALLRLIKFSHSLFALPFALSAA